MENKTGMLVIEICIENYKKISAVVVELKGGDLRVAGDTGQGKTTVISALWELLSKASDPIRHGEKSGLIRITMGDGKGPAIIAERRYTPATSTINIASEDGRKISAKEFADWFCDLAVNPHRILEQKPTDQVNTLLKAAKLPDGFNLADADRAIEAAEQERLLASRVLDREKAKFGAGPAPEKIEKVSVTDLVAELNRRQEHNRKISGALEYLDAYDKRIAEVELEISVFQDTLEKMRKNRGSFFAATQVLPEEIGPIQEAIRKADDTNSSAAKYQAWIATRDELKKVESQHVIADEKVKALRAGKKEALASAAWPIPGITVDDGKIWFKGVPLDQCGRSEQMLVTGAIAAAAISQKPIRVVRMDGVESMSQADFERLSAIFHQAGIQVLSTRVTRGDFEPGEIEIIEGELMPF